MGRSQQQWRRGSQLLLVAAAVALVFLIAAGSADAKCSVGYSVCGGRCVNLKTNPYNCNRCGKICVKYPRTLPKCRGGFCKWDCVKPYGNCDRNIFNGCESNLDYDEYNCGKCGKVCRLSPYYRNGQVYCIKGDCISKCKPGWKYNSGGKYCYR